MNPLNRIHPLTLVFSTFALLAMLLLWVKKPAPTIPPHQVQETNTIYIDYRNDILYVTNQVVAGPFNLHSPPALTNGQLLRYVTDGTNASIEIVKCIE